MPLLYINDLDRELPRIGSRIDQATIEQLRKRIQLLERWKQRGYGGEWELE